MPFTPSFRHATFNSSFRRRERHPESITQTRIRLGFRFAHARPGMTAERMLTPGRGIGNNGNGHNRPWQPHLCLLRRHSSASAVALTQFGLRTVHPLSGAAISFPSFRVLHPHLAIPAARRTIAGSRCRFSPWSALVFSGRGHAVDCSKSFRSGRCHERACNLSRCSRLRLAIVIPAQQLRLFPFVGLVLLCSAFPLLQSAPPTCDGVPGRCCYRHGGIASRHHSASQVGLGFAEPVAALTATLPPIPAYVERVRNGLSSCWHRSHWRLWLPSRHLHVSGTLLALRRGRRRGRSRWWPPRSPPSVVTMW